eukprot:g27157.t1
MIRAREGPDEPGPDAKAARVQRVSEKGTCRWDAAWESELISSDLADETETALPRPPPEPLRDFSAHSLDTKTYRDLLLSKGYHITGILGRGQNSDFVVHSAMKNGEKFAVKVSTESEQDGTNGGALRREYATLSSLKHPNIVRALQIWQGHVDEGMKGSAMILEFCGGIRLSRRLPWSDATFQLAARRKCLWQIDAWCRESYRNHDADAVAYLHSLLVAHRDLHCKNVLVNEVGKDIEVKVLDFGCARPLNSDGGVEDGVGRPPCDIFAMGLIGCSIISGKEISSWGVVPPDGESSITLPACGAKDFRLTGLMSEYLLGMLEVNGERRFKAPEALSRLPEESQWLMTQPKKLSL